MSINKERLKQVRQLRGFTLEQLGNKSGVSKWCISNMERGKTKNGKFDNLDAICRALNISVDYITTKIDEIRPYDYNILNNQKYKNFDEACLFITQNPRLIDMILKIKKSGLTNFILDLINIYLNYILNLNKKYKLEPTIIDIKIAPSYILTDKKIKTKIDDNDTCNFIVKDVLFIDSKIVELCCYIEGNEFEKVIILNLDDFNKTWFILGDKNDDYIF